MSPQHLKSMQRTMKNKNNKLKRSNYMKEALEVKYCSTLQISRVSTKIKLIKFSIKIKRRIYLKRRRQNGG